MAIGKKELRKELNEMDKPQLVGLILDLYDRNPDTKKMLQFFLEPDSEALLNEYKSRIDHEFNTARRGFPSMNFTKCRQWVAEFKRYGVAPTEVAQLMLYIPYKCCFYNFVTGGGPDKLYLYMANTLILALVYIQQNQIEDLMRPYIIKIKQLTTGHSMGTKFLARQFNKALEQVEYEL